MNRQLFWEMVVTWNCLRGEFFILPLNGMDQPVDLAASAPLVERLVTLAPEMFWHNVVGYDLAGWRYTGSPLVTPIPSEFLLPSEVIHSRQPNPYLYWRGLSPLILAMVPAAADFAASKYNQGYWLNNADTGVIVTTEQQATPEQRAAILAALRERKRKAGTADRPLFLWGGAKVEKPTLSGMETQMIENRKMNRQEILAVFKMTDSVIGLTDSKSSALSGGGSAINQEEIKFIESTICPLCEHIEAAVAPVVKTFGDGLLGWFDVDGLPIMQEARRSRLDSAIKAFSIGATFNELTRLYDLGFEEKPWGNKSFLPFSLQEAGSVGADLPAEDDPATVGQGDKEKANPFARMQKLLGEVIEVKALPVPIQLGLKELWQKHIATRRKSVKQMESKVSKVLLAYRATTLEKLSKIELPASVSQLSVFGAEQRSLIDLIFDPKAFGKSLLTELTNPILSTLQAAGTELHTELGIDDPWKMPPQKAQQWISARTQKIQNVGGTVREQLNTALNEGLDAGETMKELSDRVRGVFNHLTDVEAERVARTETNSAYNVARHAAMKDSGIGYKAWLSSHGPHVRPGHLAAEEQYSVETPIPVDEPFSVYFLEGGFPKYEDLMYPGDPSGSPGNIINCQCIQLAAKKKSEDEKSFVFAVCGLGEVTFTKEART
jgi:phage portal protein BeeE